MIHRSPFAEVQIPDLALTPFVFQHAGKYPDRPAIIDAASGRSLTYGQLQGAISACAAGLHRRGFRKGQVLAVYSPNVPEYPVVFHAVATLGGVTTTLNPLYTADEIASQLRDSGARFLVTVPPLAERALEAAGAAGVEEVFVLGEAAGATPFASLVGSPGELPEVAINPSEDLVAMPYSSGTTGLPKGVMLTHRNLVANICQIDPCQAFGDEERCIAVLPFFHIYGLVVILNMAVRKGATLISMPRFELEPFLQTMQTHRITRAYLVPPIVLALARHPLVAKYDLSSLKVLMCGAAPLQADLSNECANRLGCIVTQGYGMTETSPVTHITPDDPAMNRPGSVGRVVASTECKVAEIGSGTPLSGGERGEICVRGPQVMKGYLHNAAATSAMIDSEGWLHTGDIGYADEDGNFYIVDRVKELIKYKGFQVAPAELEAVLLSHPAVADVAVIGSPDLEAGELPKAFVVLRGEVTADVLLAFVAEKVAPHKKIRLLEVVEQIPKSPTGKILRRVLVERERAARQG